MRIIEDVFPVSFSRFSMEKEADELDDKDNSKFKLQRTRQLQTTTTQTFHGEDKNWCNGELIMYSSFNCEFVILKTITINLIIF